MNEQRNQAYLALIKALLESPRGQEPDILEAHSELIDAGLVQAMRQVAAVLEKEGNSDAATWLVNFAENLANADKNNEALQFLLAVLQATWDSKGDPQVIYPLLQQHQHFLDENLIQVLNNWAIATLPTLNLEQVKLTAAVIVEFGNLIREFTRGSKANNMEISIACYERALQVYTASAFPQDWAETQNNLGVAYLYRIKGERRDNLEQAIHCYELALQVRTSSAFPQDWAKTQNNFGSAYLYRIKGERADNLEEAIRCYERALQIRTRSAFPEQWAKTQNNLGNAYLYRIKGERADNLEEAIRCYKQALQIINSSAFAQQWAQIQNNLGNAYKNRIKGERAENLELAIAYYKQALQVFNNNLAFPEQWAMTQNNLGLAYSNRIKGERSENLEQAIRCYKRALQVYTLSAFPEQWAMTQNNLGLAYSNRIKGERTEDLEEAIACYERALEVYTRLAFPEQWSTTQNNLGIAYSDRIKGEQADNLELAIAYYKQALQVYTHSAFPQQWALTQNNLGATCSARIKGERAENLEEAITCYKRALQVYTPSAFPKDWAMTQNNLGSVLRQRIRGERAENLEQALACHQLALQIYSASAFPQDWATTQSHLGLAYSDRIRGEQAENLELAIACYERALQVITISAFPEQWASTQNNLGSAYQDRIKEERGDNLEKAIRCYERALQVYTPLAFPYQWAGTENNLGNAYRDLGKTPAAIRFYRFALEIWKPAAFPLDCLKAGRNSGNLGFTAGDWGVAIEGYGLAIEAVEQSRNWASSDASRQEITKKAIGIYEKMVQACVNSGQLDRALETVERSRSKRLVDLMASNDLYQGGEIPPEIQGYLNQYQNLQKEIDRERRRYDINNSRELTGVRTGRPYRAGLSPGKPRLVELEAQKQEIWQQLRRKDPVLAGQIQVNPLDFGQLQQLLGGQRETAILSFYSTSKDTYIFILRHQPEEDKVSVFVRSCCDRGYDMQNWILERWLNPYIQGKAQWQGQMESVLAELAGRLQIDELVEQHLAGIQELILVPHLYLHQIPFAALPLTGGEYLGDRFRIRTVPSCQVLQFCQNRPPAIASKYGTVEDATENLPYARFEGERIARLYQIPPSQRLQGRRQATVSNYQRLAREVHALHSSHHAQSRLDNPLESKLILGDGDITLGELMTPGWRSPELVEVFLSCCETGLGNIEITDDILTIAAGFLCAGARSVVSTLWAVDDLAAAVFSLIYYRYRQENLTRSAALQLAQQDLRQLTGDEFARDYGSELQAELEEKLPELEAKYKEVQKQLWQAKKTLKKSTLNSEREELEQKIAELKKVGDSLHEKTKEFNQIQKHLEAKSREPYPFAALQYWAAFVCQGMA